MISICMIVKNEEKNIGECLKRLLALNYEIIIVDTGSVDKTKEIAKNYTNKVYDFIWNNNFAEARNYAIQQASNDYVLIIDSDEMVMDFQKVELENMVKRHPKAIGRILLVNEFTRSGEKLYSQERISRLFHRKLYHYQGIIHEQLVSFKNKGNLYNVPLKVKHLGYEGNLEIRRKKTKRNIELLMKQLEQKEEPYILYQLGKSYYMEEDYEKANKYFNKALQYDLEPKLEYVQDMVEVYGYSLLETKQYDVAMGLLNIYEEFSNSADYLFLIALVYMNNAYFNEAIEEFLKATSKLECKMQGVNNYLAWYNIGVIFECLGEKEKAKKYYKKCKDYGKAKERIKQL